MPDPAGQTGETAGRRPLRATSERTYDVAVIGAGVNGCAAAQQLAADGYSVLLIDKADFAAGASGRSSRLLHCGLRYLAPGRSMWEFLRYPHRFWTACRMAREAMRCRSEFATDTPERVREFTFHYPVYRDSPYRPWQIDAAFRLLALLGPRCPTLAKQRLQPDAIRSTPLIKWLRDQDALQTVVAFREYQFVWPERIAVDSAMDADRLGAFVRNYTSLESMSRTQDGSWSLNLRDTLRGDEACTAYARIVVNMAGPWIDQVSATTTPRAARRVTGTKGVHIMVRLPEECRGQGIATVHRQNQPFYCVPWGKLHYFGPTETLFEGNADDVRPESEEIDWLVDEANHLLPQLALTRQDVLFAWAGVRPLTYDPDQPMGSRDRTLHDLAPDGLSGVLALTGGPIMTHRSTARMIRDAIRRRLAPSDTDRALSRRGRPIQTPEPGVPPDPEVIPSTGEIREIAATEAPGSLYDLLFRRFAIGWSESMGARVADAAAEAAAEPLGLDDHARRTEIERFFTELREHHCFGGVD